MSARFVLTRRLSGALIVIALLFPAMPCAAQSNDRDLTELSLEDLLNVQVTSAAKREEKLSQTAAAIYVITGDDIRHSGVTTLADALRLAPGVQVSQISSNAWAVTIRGFGSLYSNKLLVLVDGRSVYSPIFSGVLWNRQDTFLDDIDRIEVIRGPGASLWGSNAVNGVINIITKSAKETQGGMITAATGNHERDFGGVRYGGSFSPDFHYRVYGKYFARSDLSGYGVDFHDAWDFGRGGVRADWNVTQADSITMEGEYYRGTPGPITNLLPLLALPVSQSDASGGNGLVRWKHAFDGGSEMAWQMYYDRTYRPEFPLAQNEDTLDLDFQDSLRLKRRHQIVWGGGVRRTTIRTQLPAMDGVPLVSIAPEITLHLFSGFVQDEITLVPDRVRLTAGIRLEDNEFSGVEVEPTLRLLYTPSARQAFWAAVSRAARTPNVSETDISEMVTMPNVPFPLLLLPNPHPQSETVLAYEAGYRVAPAAKMSFDVAGFYSHYDHLATNAPLSIPGRPTGMVLQWGNGALGQTYGAEVSATYVPWQKWKVQGSYSLFRGSWAASRAERKAFPGFLPGSGPTHQFQIRSTLNLTHSVRMDTSFFYAGDWGNLLVSSDPKLDNSIEWHATRNLELQFVVQNALHPRHVEFYSFNLMQPGAYIERSIYGKMTWHF